MFRYLFRLLTQPRVTAPRFRRLRSQLSARTANRLGGRHSIAALRLFDGPR